MSKINKKSANYKLIVSLFDEYIPQSRMNKKQLSEYHKFMKLMYHK